MTADQHVRQLCQQRHIHLIEGDPQMRAMAATLGWDVFCSASRSPEGEEAILLSFRGVYPDHRYFLALHEIGHHATGYGPRGGDNWTNLPRLTQEALAWDWALDVALFLPPQPVARVLYRAVRSYYDDARYKNTRRYLETLDYIKELAFT